MLTRPATFAQAVDQEQGRAILLIRIVVGAASKMYANAPVLIGDGVTAVKAENRLLYTESWGFTESINVHECTFQIPTCEIVINNYVDPGTLARPSDDWSAFWQSLPAGYVEVYFLNGEKVTALSDCLLVFKGRATQYPACDGSTMTISVEAWPNVVHRTLPVTRVRSLGGTYTGDHGRYLPIAFGEHVQGNGEIYDSTRWGGRVGRIRAVRTSSTRFYLHEGASNAANFWIKKKNGTWFELSSPPTPATDGNNRSYVDIGDGRSSVQAYLHVHPANVVADPGYYGVGTERDQEYYITTMSNAEKDANTFRAGMTANTDASLAFDKDATTAALVASGVHFYKNDGSGFDSMDKGLLSFGFGNVLHENGSAYTVSEALLLWDAELAALSGYTILYGTTSAGSPFHATEVALRSSQSSFLRDFASDIFDGTQQALDVSSAIGSTDVLSSRYAMFSVMAVKETASDPGTIAGTMLSINEVLLRLRVNLFIEDTDELWYVGGTAQVGSDIAGRGGSNPSSTTTNKTPYFIMEQILRKQLLVGSSAIDTAQIDSLYDATLTLALAIDQDESVHSLRLLQEIGENSEAMYYMTPTGLHTVLPRLPAAPGSVDATISRHHCVAFPQITETPTRFVLNDLTVEYDFDRESKRFRLTQVLTDATSISRYATRGDKRASLRFLDPAIITAGTHDFVTMLKALMYYSRAVVTIETGGQRFSHIEVGDFFSLDATFDPHGTFRGSTWVGTKFYVIGRQIRTNSVTLEGMYVS